MAHEQAFKEMQERNDRLEKLVISLMIEGDSAPTPAADLTVTNVTNNAQNASSTNSKSSTEGVTGLMRLPTKIRMDIFELVIRPIFTFQPYRAKNCGLTLPLELPVTIYTSNCRFPALLHTSQTIRAESMKIYLGLARTTIADLEVKNKETYKDWIAGISDNSSDQGGWRHAELGRIVQDNFVAMSEIDVACQLLEGKIMHKHKAQHSIMRW